MKEELPLNKEHFLIGDHVFYVREAFMTNYCQDTLFCEKFEIKSISTNKGHTHDGTIFLGKREGLGARPMERCFRNKIDGLQLVKAELHLNISRNYATLDKVNDMEDSIRERESS